MNHLAHASKGTSGEARFEGMDLYSVVLGAVRGAGEETASKIPAVYREALALDFFAGGWCEDPEFPKEDYEAYRKWVRSPDAPLPEGCREKFALIGANRLWELHDKLFARASHSVAVALADAFPGRGQSDIRAALNDLKMLNSAAVSIEDGQTISSQKECYDGSGFTYEYKVLHIRDDKAGHFRLRAVSTRELSGSLDGKSIRDDVNAQNKLLGLYRAFDAAVREGVPIYYRVNVVFNLEGLQRDNPRRANAVIAAMFS